MANIFKDIKEMTDAVVNSASKGFGVFMRNALIIILLLILSCVMTNPQILYHPTEFFQNFDKNVIWVIVIAFILIGTIYQLAVGLNKTIKDENTNKLVEQIVNDIEINRIQKTTKKNEEHNLLIEKRINASPIIRSELKDLIIRLGATRASICEMHNGTNNLTGFPFLYLDMTYEEAATNKVFLVSDEYKNFNMVKYPFIANHISDGLWIGSLDDVKKEDQRLASKFMFSDSNYGAFMVIRGTTGIIGVLIVTFKYVDNIPSDKEIISAMTSTSQIVSTLLDRNS